MVSLHPWEFPWDQAGSDFGTRTPVEFWGLGKDEIHFLAQGWCRTKALCVSLKPAFEVSVVTSSKASVIG